MENFLVFDIGANVGNFSAKCIEEIKGSKVIAVEPNTDLLEGLKKKFFNK